MDRADAGASQHGHDGFGNHRHIEAHPITLADAAVLQHVRQSTDLFVQLAIGERAALIRLIALPNDGRLVPPRREMPINTVETGVQSPAFKPADVAFREIPIEHLVPPRGPRHEGVGLFAPETFGIVDRTPVQVAILCLRDMGACPKRFRNRVDIVAHTTST